MFSDKSAKPWFVYYGVTLIHVLHFIAILLAFNIDSIWVALDLLSFQAGLSSELQ